MIYYVGGSVGILGGPRGETGIVARPAPPLGGARKDITKWGGGPVRPGVEPAGRNYALNLVAVPEPRAESAIPELIIGVVFCLLN